MLHFSLRIAGKRRPIKRRRLFFVIFFVSVALYAFLDYRGPSTINLKDDMFFGIPCKTAHDLVVQQFDKDNNLWATRGMVIYEKKNGTSKFVRKAHVPTGNSIFWLRNFSLLRHLTLRPECIEMVISEENDICAVSAGKIWYKSHDKKKFVEAMKLRNYGFGDQGLRNSGILLIDSIIYIGEYFRNPSKTDVRIFKSSNGGKTWETAYDFKPGQIRHIHSVQKDNYSDKIWVNVGDSHPESMITYSDNDFRTLNVIGSGSEQWRICQMIFSEDALYWGTDTGIEDHSGIFKFDRLTQKVTKLAKIHGAVFFGTRLENGIIVMTTSREGMDNEKDDKTHMILMDKNEKMKSISCGTWNLRKPKSIANFATLRMQRNQGSASLAITGVNQKEFRTGDLFIISQEDLAKALK